MKKILPPLLLAFALVCAFTACRSNTESMAAGLKVEVTAVERTGDGSVRVAWRVQNPNVFSYLLNQTTQKLTLNGTLIGTLSDTTPLGVPAQSHAERTGILTSVNAPAGAALDQAVAQGSATYRLDSVLTVLLLDEQMEKIALTGSGTVTVTAK